MERNGRAKRMYLCNLNLVNLELGVWMRLLCVKDLLYGDRSECVFPICSLNSKSAEGKGRSSVRPRITFPAAP